MELSCQSLSSTLDWTNGSGFYDDNSALIDNSDGFTAQMRQLLSSIDDIPHTQGFWVKTSSVVI